MAPVFQRGRLPSRKRACTMRFVPAICSSGLPFLRLLPVLRLAKNAAYSQNCCRLQVPEGWLWHWAHSILTPRNSREVLAARFSGLNPWAAKYTLCAAASSP